MKTLLAVIATTSNFTIYAGPNSPDPRIEAVTRRGPIYELIVKCRRGTAIISYAPADDRYCSPRFVCSASRTVAIAEACGGAK